jgi:hypothetical protein
MVFNRAFLYFAYDFSRIDRQNSNDDWHQLPSGPIPVDNYYFSNVACVLFIAGDINTHRTE